jgi:pimeloyl-ACP methyl ester carboxylesterase
MTAATAARRDTAKPFEEQFFTARDGLKLYARCYPAAAPRSSRPVVCLAGLTRNSRDFHDLAVALSSHPEHPRVVYTLDTRGRGRSEFDKDWTNYAVPIELQDVIDFLIVAGLEEVSLVGTSRGGLIGMLLGAVMPGAIGAVVLNDIGPVIEQQGLARIAGYVGRAPLPHSWTDAMRMVRDMNKRHFPSVSDAQWEEVARQLFNEVNGKPAPGYDPQLSRSLSVLDGPAPQLWPQFEALKRVPVLVLRGENSDILSDATVAEMHRRHPALISLVVPEQGHAPLLKDRMTLEAVRRFLDAAETGNVVTGIGVA